MRYRFVVTSAVLRGLQADLDADQPITVGRVSGNSLVLDHKSVSRYHARLEPNGSALRLVDLRSHNGTRVGEELVSERDVRPGDLLGFGEVRVQFIAVDPATADAGPCASPTATESAGLPVLASAGGPGMALAKPLSVQEIFGGPAAAPTATMQAASSRMTGTLLYVLALVAVLVLGGVALWKGGEPPFRPPVLAVQLRAGDLLPVHIGPQWDAVNQRAIGLTKIESVGEPDDQNIAYVTKTRFKGFVVVHGRALGTTDVRMDGPDKDGEKGYLILRILVRGVPPDEAWVEWLLAAHPERRRRAEELIRQAKLSTPKGDLVDSHTSDAIRDYELAAKLLEGVPGAMTLAASATQEATRLRALRDAKYDELTRRIDDCMREGRYKDAIAACEDLIRIYTDPESEEYHVVRHYYNFLLREIAREQAKQEQEEKERR